MPGETSKRPRLRRNIKFDRPTDRKKAPPEVYTYGGRRMSYIHMFRMRMEREGRIKEWWDRQRKARGEGLFHSQAVHRVMKEMGYEGPEQERAYYYEWERSRYVSVQQQAEEELLESQRLQREQRQFEVEFSKLPDTAPAHKELDWIRAHPAMGRKSRMDPKNEEYVMVSVADIMSAPHGAAPSKSAVNALQHWVNLPNEFYKQVLSEHKKKGGESADDIEDEGDMDISDAQQLLKAVQKANGEAEKKAGRRKPLR